MTPVSTLISLTALLSGVAHAEGGARGDNGQTSPAAFILYGGQAYGASGGDGALPGAGSAAAITGRTITIGPAGSTDVVLSGSAGAAGGSVYRSGGGVGGLGGALVTGGISEGGAGGNSADANGGNAGAVSGNTVTVIDARLTGAAGGDGGSVQTSASLTTALGAGGAGGHGGGSFFGGISTGGAGGGAKIDTMDVHANGGNAGDVVGNTVLLTRVRVDAASANGGNGGGVSAPGSSIAQGGGGAAGLGGGSVVGGVSTGGAAGAAHTLSFSPSLPLANGGHAGAVSQNTLLLNDVQLIGAAGGDGGSVSHGAMSSAEGGGGAAGHGGGSVFGGISTGGAGGSAETSSRFSSSARGGNGGDVSNNVVSLNNVELVGGAGGSGAQAAAVGGGSADGFAGGSVFGGISTGGAGGEALLIGLAEVSAPLTRSGGAQFTNASRGNGGNVTGNRITLSGNTSITGNIYGGVSQGGSMGNDGVDGTGGLASGNVVTLSGSQLKIGTPASGGSVYGGLSINGDGTQNTDPEYASFYQGNTLNLVAYRGSVKSVRNFENYNWVLPQDVFGGDTLMTINNPSDPAYKVELNGTKHLVDVLASGNQLNAGDKVVLINKAQGAPELLNNRIEQGFFVVYDASMAVQNEELVLTIQGVVDDKPDGKVSPESEAFLQGRAAQLAFVDQGADMISDYGISFARASLSKQSANLFVVVDGGSSRYKTGGHVRIHDFKLAVGAAKAFELKDKSAGMVGVFVEHGDGRYSSNNDFGAYGEVDGSGRLRYNGVGAMFHVDVAGTGGGQVDATPDIFDARHGLYVNAAFRVGDAKVGFRTDDLVNANGESGRYDSKSRYMTAMAGTGYVWALDSKQAVDFYGRYTWSRLNAKDVQVVDEDMSFGSAHSQRLRVGARYGYAYEENVIPYIGLAYERNFKGDVSGSAYGFTIKENSLRGNTGILELGAMVKPMGVNAPLSVHVGVQGYVGQREGVSAAAKVRYVF